MRPATTLRDNPAVARMAEVVRELKVVLSVSFFERAGHAPDHLAVEEGAAEDSLLRVDVMRG